MKKQIFIFALLILVGSSCGKKLEVTPPSQIIEEQILELLKEKPELVLERMVGDMEDRLVSTGVTDMRYKNFQTYNIAMALRGNDMVFVRNGQVYFWDDYQFRGYRTAAINFNGWYWELLYKHVYTANVILNLMPDEIPDTDAGKKLKRYKASAHTMRAFGYTYLMWIYTDDYVTKNKNTLGIPLYEVNTMKAADRSPASDVWGLILKDAKEAVKLFKESGHEPSASLNDFDAVVANMVLARAAVSTGEWQTAIDAANDVYALRGGWNLMSKDVYLGTAEAQSGFVDRHINTEAILAFDYNKTKPGASFNGTSFNGWMNIYGSGQGGEGGGYMAIDKRLYDQIGDNDYRKLCFLVADKEFTYNSVGAKGTTFMLKKYMNTKFSSLKGKNETLDNTWQDEIIMRTSEVLLLKAEAQYRIGDIPGAQLTIAELLSARTDGAVTSVSETGDALFQLIQLQSRIELWGENASEYYNNKRWNISVDRTGGPTVTNHTEANTAVIPAGVAFTYQIPLTELNYNTNIKVQNP